LSPLLVLLLAFLFVLDDLRLLDEYDDEEEEEEDDDFFCEWAEVDAWSFSFEAGCVTAKEDSANLLHSPDTEVARTLNS
jgi:hypothetical protein